MTRLRQWKEGGCSTAMYDQPNKETVRDDFGDPITVWAGYAAVVVEPDPYSDRFVFTVKQSKKLRKALKRAEKKVKENSVRSR